MVQALREQGRRATIVATTLAPSLVQMQQEYPPDQWGYTLKVLDEGKHAITVQMA